MKFLVKRGLSELPTQTLSETSHHASIKVMRHAGLHTAGGGASDCRSRPRGYKTFFSCSTQLCMKFFMLINIKQLTIANCFLLNTAEHENFSANNYENANYCWHFHIY